MNPLTIASRGLGILAAGAVVILGASFGPTLLGYESAIVTSGSMGKANPVGSVAVSRMVDARSIRTGDVVSFQTQSDSRITHRVISVTEVAGQRVLETQGDASVAADPEPLRLTTGEVAKVQWSVPYAGYLVRYARTPAGSILLFVIPILGLISEKRKRHKLGSVAIPQAESVSAPSSMSLPCPRCAEPLVIALGLEAQRAKSPATIDLVATHGRFEVPYIWNLSEEGKEVKVPALTQERGQALDPV